MAKTVAEQHEEPADNRRLVPITTLHLQNDLTVPFEAYLHYASLTRASELAEREGGLEESRSLVNIMKRRFAKSNNPIAPVTATTENKTGEEMATPAHMSMNKKRSQASQVTDEEWRTLSRSVRTAGWSSCFYLITTDVLGPYNTPWAFAQMGYGPGIALFTVFGALAGLSGFYIWRIFIQLDSDRFPLRDFGIATFRIFGARARYVVNVLQSLQIILTVSGIILGQGQAIAQISAGTSSPVCFVVCLVIFTIVGMVIGQIRTLQRLGWLSNLCLWLILTSLFICMGVAANSPPNFKAMAASFGPSFGPGPIKTFAATPPPGLASGGDGFIGSLNGLNQAVYSYGGVMLFINFLAEMRHPWDFWKALICAQSLIYVVYLFFGIFMYSYQGQYSYIPATQSLSPYHYQTAANILYIIVGLIAAVLYGNVGIKVVYVNVFQELLNAPHLATRAGKIFWVIAVPTYWALAFGIAAAIPQFSSVSGLVGAVCVLSFTYTLPALLQLGFQIQKDAMLPNETFDQTTGVFQRQDDGWRRYMRGYMVKWHLNTFNAVYALGALVTTALGIYSSVEALIAAFGGRSVATSFGCKAPV